MEKQLQQQLNQMAQYQRERGIQPPQDDKELQRLRKELEKAQGEVKNCATEKERLQAQLEMLVQELEKNQVFNKLSIKTSFFLFSNCLLFQLTPPF